MISIPIFFGFDTIHHPLFSSGETLQAIISQD